MTEISNNTILTPLENNKKRNAFISQAGRNLSGCRKGMVIYFKKASVADFFYLLCVTQFQKHSPKIYTEHQQSLLKKRAVLFIIK
jgi:hypothetical protein